MDEKIIEKFKREDLSLASNLNRGLAFMLDELIVSMLFAVIYWNKFAAAGTFEQTLLLVNNLVLQVIILKVAYQSFFVWMYGATLGKLAFRIRVISIDLLDNPNLFISILRANVRIISEWILYLGFLWGLLNPAKQTWHDKMARTLVINV